MDSIKKEFSKKIYVPVNLRAYAEKRKMLYFDIETTGLSSEFNSIILIGMSYEKNGVFTVEQLFCEKMDEEELILEEFIRRLDEFDTIVTYNGRSFDVPFVNARMKNYNMNYSIKHENLDIICHVRPNKQVLGLSSCSLKSVERLLGIGREDEIDGGESVRLYYEYLRNGNSRLKEQILLHNFEDVYNLPEVLRVFDTIRLNDTPDRLTSKQRSFLMDLLKRKKFVLKRQLDSLSKQEASKLIDYILNGTDCDYEDYLERRG
jgi:uncharacterized protein YprB with RNaseH-like and TPR domain